MASVDVTVRGGGIFGLSCAWELARRGARVRLIERERIGAGSSGGLVGALSPHIPEQWNPKKQFQLESLLMAGQFWAGIAHASGQNPGYARVGRLQTLADDTAVVQYFLNHAHVGAVPGAAYGLSPYFRISTATSDVLLQDAIDRIARAVSALSEAK